MTLLRFPTHRPQRRRPQRLPAYHHALRTAWRWVLRLSQRDHTLWPRLVKE